MAKEYLGYIKRTKSGKFRGVIGTLHSVGETDGDKVVQTSFESELTESLEDVIADLIEICKDNNIDKVYTTPIRKGQILWESAFAQLDKVTYEN